MASSSEGADELSTSSDEELQVKKGGAKKRDRKHYRPEDDEELFNLDDDEDEEDDTSCISEDSSQIAGTKPYKRRKSLTVPRKTGDSGPEQELDQDELALQQAIAMSVVETGPERRANSHESEPLNHEHSHFDAEDAAMKQALAYSLTESCSPIATAEKEEKKLRGRIQQIDLEAEEQGEKRDSKSKAVKIQSRSKSLEGQGKKMQKPAFPAPSLEMVQQAFQMLDPTGSGSLNPIALREVASKLLHKDLDEDQLDAMMEFAETMSHSQEEAATAESRMVDADAFCRLVARFAGPE